jgi:aromatic-L-amino-acid/L-tryptophan decarboxylase
VRGISAIGIPDALVRVIPTDESFTIDVARLRDQIALDKASGLTPTVVIATAGTTNTGAVDDLAAIAEISENEGMWFHVDGAYGGPAALTGQGKSMMSGLERANSFVLDPHKWLFSPYDIACLWVSTPGVLEKTFAMYPEYLKDVSEGTVNFHNRSLELSRRSRAIKLWLTIRTYGFIKISAAIERGVELAEYAQSLIEQIPELSVVTPAQLGIVTFTFKEQCDLAAIARELTESGFAALTTTSLKGQEVLRLCIINPATTELDVSETLKRLVQIYHLRADKSVESVV